MKDCINGNAKSIDIWSWADYNHIGGLCRFVGKYSFAHKRRLLLKIGGTSLKTFILLELCICAAKRDGVADVWKYT